MGDGAVDEEVPEGDEGEHGAEAHALGEGAADDGGGDDGEGALKHHEHTLWNGAVQGMFGSSADSKW